MGEAGLCRGLFKKQPQNSPKTWNPIDQSGKLHNYLRKKGRAHVGAPTKLFFFILWISREMFGRARKNYIWDSRHFPDYVRLCATWFRKSSNARIFHSRSMF